MIQKLEINGVHTKVDKDLHEYVNKKIGNLDHYMSRHVRESAHAEVKLIEKKIKTRSTYMCEVILYLPHDVITSKETTVSMTAAVDAVEAKLKNQLKKYKDKQERPHKLHRRLLSKIRRR